MDPNENDDPNVQGTESPVGDSGTDGSGNGNDLYSTYLERFPESLRPIAVEVFKEWDGNVTKRIQGIHQEYEPYKPLVDTYDAESLSSAAQLAEALDKDPEKVWRAIAETYGFQVSDNPAPQVPVVDDGGGDLDPNDPVSLELAQQRQLLETLAQTLISEREAKQQETEQQEQDRLFDEMWNGLKTTHGEFDEQYVLALITQGVDPEQAVSHWKSQLSAFAQKQLEPNSSAPVVMSSAGGGTPSVQRDVSTMSSQELKAFMVQTLEAAAREGK